MVHYETEVTEHEAESFQVIERLNAGVNIDLFSKTVKSVVSGQYHLQSVIAGVIHNHSKVTAT